ncbi:hypothetical protein D7X33_13055 [Butyricicoccus sp. 1XD8-22]|nr:hypothetical protein D7X33_13055 [Butyricicoccus sp. 1XD8-22]
MFDRAAQKAAVCGCANLLAAAAAQAGRRFPMVKRKFSQEPLLHWAKRSSLTAFRQMQKGLSRIIRI